jgi:hypothetical protein
MPTKHAARLCSPPRQRIIEASARWMPLAWGGVRRFVVKYYPRRVDVLDIFHETAHAKDERKVIARSFAEFLSDALVGGGRQYWLASGFKGYGYR